MTDGHLDAFFTSLCKPNALKSFSEQVVFGPLVFFEENLISRLKYKLLLKVLFSSYSRVDKNGNPADPTT